LGKSFVFKKRHRIADKSIKSARKILILFIKRTEMKMCSNWAVVY